MSFFITLLEEIYFSIRTIIFIPYIRNQEIVQPSKINLISMIVFVIITFVSTLCFIVLKLPKFADMNLRFFGLFLCYVNMLVTLTSSFGTVLFKYKCMRHIAMEILALNHLTSYRRVREIVTIIFITFFWLFVCTFMNFYVWKLTSCKVAEIAFYICNIISNFYVYFILQIFLHDVRIVQYIFLGINSKVMKMIEVGGLRKVSLSGNPKLANDVVKERIKRIARFHSGLCDIACKLNSAFSLQVLVVITEAFIAVSFQLYFTIFIQIIYDCISARLVDAITAAILMQLTTLFSITKWLQITSSCTRASREVRYLFYLVSLQC